MGIFNKKHTNTVNKEKSTFPEKVPFWTRMKVGGKHPALVIDREKVVNKKTKKEEPGFVYREGT